MEYHLIRLRKDDKRSNAVMLSALSMVNADSILCPPSQQRQHIVLQTTAPRRCSKAHCSSNERRQNLHIDHPFVKYTFEHSSQSSKIVV